jgi:hypothetical protein
MKKRRTIILVAVMAMVGIGFALWRIRGPQPTLVFKGYERSGTNGAQIAVLELQNPTSQRIWLCFHGINAAPSPEFLERPIFALPRTNNSNGPNLFSVTVGSVFFSSEVLDPGEARILHFSVVSGMPQVQVGLRYYVGNFKDGNDFMAKAIEMPVLSSEATLKDRAKYFWWCEAGRFIGRKTCDVWCPNVLAFQAGMPTNANVSNEPVQPH